MYLIFKEQILTPYKIKRQSLLTVLNTYSNLFPPNKTLCAHFQQLAGKKALINDYFNDKTIIIDATETPIQRPKKDKNNLILVKRKNTPLKHK
ncbi:hypothetical protein [Spiroplasma endosymbiont of Eupeodes luniger]|uniref:hypothetical protein n=1 Tax=Spiroplasma endosymbiont of Eupeodes luniger TaxID=3066300 RepID=UPI0030D52812